MSDHLPYNPSGVRVTNPTLEKTRLEIFLPSLDSTPDGGDKLVNETEETREGVRSCPLEEVWSSMSKSSPLEGVSNMAHPLYKSSRDSGSNVPPKLKTRFTTTTPVGNETSSLSAAASQTNSAGILGDLNGLPSRPGFSKDAKFLSSYSHNYGHSEGGKTWWSSK
ncbi:uncharacterized protein LOC117304556 [Asterias rubens]|uniref:uncharacterized protein LOC117304556 n=1 Tax=Asterias rubens TaxID=7604 RepID=UPI001455346F|nr:uncharacterized protein LOC117304556 [Asterias rubens]XP_033644973.1 uncharacterized protein LOC117304556 [Asterias rubens]